MMTNTHVELWATVIAFSGVNFVHQPSSQTSLIRSFHLHTDATKGTYTPEDSCHSELSFSMSGERRTRSQLVVPDHIMATANVSPYKQARQAVKQHPMAARKLQFDNTDETVLATDVGTSEQLGQGTSSKRSASPEASEDRVTALEEREIKRAKLQGMSLDGQDVNGDAEAPERAPHSPGTKGKSHGRHASEPNPPRPFAGPSEETRARSVPLLFPAVPKSPKIDFVSLHRESPTRAQRFPEFRIQTLFPQPEELEFSVPMQVDTEEPRPTPASPLSTPDVTTASRSRTPLVLNIEIPPSSPMSKSDLLAELSPLSSVPDTSFEQETSVSISIFFDYCLY